MKILLMLFVFMIASPGNLWAGKLDIDYIQTSPTKALAYSILIPGGGYFYLAPLNPKYDIKGWVFLGLGIGSYIYLASQIKKQEPFQYAIAGITVVGIKILEFGEVIDDAEKERFKRIKTSVRREDQGAL